MRLNEINKENLQTILAGFDRNKLNYLHWKYDKGKAEYYNKETGQKEYYNLDNIPVVRIYSVIFWQKYTDNGYFVTSEYVKSNVFKKAFILRYYKNKKLHKVWPIEPGEHMIEEIREIIQREVGDSSIEEKYTHYLYDLNTNKYFALITKHRIVDDWEMNIKSGILNLVPFNRPEDKNSYKSIELAKVSEHRYDVSFHDFLVNNKSIMQYRAQIQRQILKNQKIF